MSCIFKTRCSEETLPWLLRWEGFSHFKPLPERIKALLCHFLSQNQVDPSLIKFSLSGDRKSEGFYIAGFGCTEHQTAQIILSSSFVDYLEGGGELEKEGQFFLLRQVAHIDLKHSCLDTRVQKRAAVGWVNLTVFFSVLGLAKVFLPFGWAVSCLVGYGAAKWNDRLSCKSYWEEELAANAYIAQIAPLLTYSVRQKLEATRKEHLAERSFWTIPLEGSLGQKLGARLKGMIRSIQFDAKGNRRFDWSSPSLSQQVDSLRQKNDRGE